MIEERLKYARTGHRDCCGDMIRRRDTVITRDGEGRVIWACGKWWIVYHGRRAEALNKYPAGEIRKVSEDGTIDSVPALSHKSIVPGQRNDCPAQCPAIVPSIKRSVSIGYINYGTVGQ